MNSYCSGPLISVVIPTFNRERTILRSIASVLNQSYSNIELLIVDDCSTDNTQSIISTISDNRVRYLKSQTNIGAGAARNLGAKEARGVYIAFQDSDDQWRNDKLQLQYRAAQLHPESIIITRMRRHNYPKGQSPIIPLSSIAPGPISNSQVALGNIVGMPTVFLKREIFLDNPFDENLRYCEDAEWGYRVSRFNDFYLMDDILVDVYLQKDSVTVQNTKYREDFFKKILSYDNQYLHDNPKLHLMALEGYVKCCVQQGNNREAFTYLDRAISISPSMKLMIKRALLHLGLLKWIYPASS